MSLTYPINEFMRSAHLRASTNSLLSIVANNIQIRYLVASGGWLMLVVKSGQEWLRVVKSGQEEWLKRVVKKSG